MNEEKDLYGKSGIYMWTSPSGKNYIGQTVDLGVRHKDFRCASLNRTYAGKNSIIDKARQKYDYPLWKYCVLEYCSKDELNEREKYWIKFYNTIDNHFGYNITFGGIGGNGVPKSAFKKGQVRTQEQIDKARKTLKQHLEEGAINYEDKCKAVAVYTKDGCFVSTFSSHKEACIFVGYRHRNLSYAMDKNSLVNKLYLVRSIIDDKVPMFIEPYKKVKKKMPAWAVEKMSKAKRGKPNPKLWVKVASLDKNGQAVKCYNSITEAAQDVYPVNLKSANKNIQAAAKGRKKTAYGYGWCYYNI